MEPCIICYKLCISSPQEEVSPKAKKDLPRFFQYLERHLTQDKTADGVEEAMEFSLFENLLNSGMVDCCGDCSQIVESFSKLYHQMKSIELLLNWKVAMLKEIILSTERMPARLRNFREFVKRLEIGFSSTEIIEMTFDFKRNLVTKFRNKLRRAFPRLSLVKYQPQDGMVETHKNLETIPISLLNKGVVDALAQETVIKLENARSRLRSIHHHPPGKKAFTNLTREHKKQSHGQNGHLDSPITDSSSSSENEEAGDSDFEFSNVLHSNDEIQIKKDIMFSDSETTTQNDETDEESLFHTRNISSSGSNPEIVTKKTFESEGQISNNDQSEQSDTNLEKSDNLGFKCYVCDESFKRIQQLVSHRQASVCKTSCLKRKAKVTKGKCHCAKCRKGHSFPTSQVGLPDVVADAEEVLEDNGDKSKMPTQLPTIQSNEMENITSASEANEGDSQYSIVLPSELPFPDVADGEEIIFNPQARNYKCSLCPKVYKFRKDCRCHYEIAHLKVRYKCNLCPKEFTRKVDNKRHHRTEHQGLRYKCDKCNKLFTQKCSLSQHLLNTGCRSDGDASKSPAVHKCTLCDKEFKQYRNLKHHVKAVHNKVRDHLCSQCGKGFPLQYHLLQHVRTVHGQLREHLCDLCGKEYKCKSSLGKHLRKSHKGMDGE